MKQMMNDLQNAKFNTVCALLVLFGRYPEILAALTALAAEIISLTAITDEISKLAVDRDGKKSSTKKVKPDSRKATGKYSYKYSRKLHSVGKLENITELNNLARPSLSEIQRMAFNNFKDFSTELLLLMKKYATKLIAHNVTQAMITEFEEMVNAYTDTLSNTDATHAQGVGETEELEVKINNMMKRLYIVDEIVDGIKDDYPEFCQAYHSARIVHNYSLKHKIFEELAALRAKAAERKARRAAKRAEAKLAKKAKKPE